MRNPHDNFNWPVGLNTGNRIQQLWVNAQPSPISTLKRPSIQNSVPSVPKPVRGIHITRAAIPGTSNVRVNVHFNRNAGDVAYQGANIYLKSGNGTHAIVGSTQNTQTSFVVPKSSASSVITVQSMGSGSAVPVANSPSRAVNLG